MDKKTNLIIYGQSDGDMSVGIPSGMFEIDTGLPNNKETKEILDSKVSDKRFKNYREYIAFVIGKLFYGLHDNGDVSLNFSDEEDDFFSHTIDNKMEVKV